MDDSEFVVEFDVEKDIPNMGIARAGFAEGLAGEKCYAISGGRNEVSTRGADDCKHWGVIPAAQLLDNYCK